MRCDNWGWLLASNPDGKTLIVLKPDISTSEMQEGIESIGEFVVSRGEATELIEMNEKSLDEISLDPVATAFSTAQWRSNKEPQTKVWLGNLAESL